MKVYRSLEYKQVRGKRRTSNLIYVQEHKCLYVLKKNFKGVRDFICYQTIIIKKKTGDIVPKCTARIQIDKEGRCRAKSEHTAACNHELIYKDMETKNNFIDDIVEITAKLKDLPVNGVSNNDIFTREMSKRPLGESDLRFDQLERNARRYRNSFPKKPKSPQDIIQAFEDKAIFEEYALNLRKTHPFYIGTEIHKNHDKSESFFSVFASHQIIKMIEDNIEPENRKYLIDGTFKVRPTGGFYQLMIIHIEYKNDVFPLIYVIMSGKSAKCYEKVFQYIETHVFKLRPSRFMTDFESGLRAAINHCYSTAILNGCWFHYCAAIRRHMLSNKMYNLITENEQAMIIYRSLLSLPLLPTESILEGYSTIKRQAKFGGLYDDFKIMFNYFESFWLALHSHNSLSVAHLNMRTTSSLESFHSALNRSMAKRANFFRFLVGLKYHESRKADKMANLIKNNMPSNQFDRRHKSDKDREIKISELTKLLVGKEISISTFLQDMATDEDFHEYEPSDDFNNVDE